MSTNFMQAGQVLVYNAKAAIASGDLVIMGAIAGVAKTDIAAGGTGAVHITGVYSLPKAGEAITQGTKVYWSNNHVTTTKTDGVLIGVAANSSISSDSFAQVLLNVGL